jgi:hypothetical protein
MTDFEAFNATTNPIIRLEKDWNNLLAHGLEKGASYIFRKNGSYYEAIQGGTSSGAGTIAYGGADNAGATDGTSAADTLNAAIAALTTGGAIFIKNGVYSFTDAIAGSNGVRLVGESMGPFDSFTVGTILQDTGAGAAPFVDFQDKRHFGLENLKLYLNGGASTSGLRLGGTAAADPRTKAIVLRNVTIDSFAVGIQGSTYGPDDSSLYDCFVGNASSMAIDNMSSQVKMVGGTIYETPIGFRVDRTGGGHPDCGNQFYGTVFSGADVCIEVIGDSSVRGMSFYGCWFEDADTMILRTTNATAGTDLGFYYFFGCYGYVNTGADIFDLSETTVRLLWDGGELYPADDPSDIVTNGGTATTQYIGLRGYLPGQERINFNDTASGLRGLSGKHFKLFYDPTNVGLSAGNAAAWHTFAPNSWMPYRQYEVCHAHVIYRWNPGSASGGLRLAFPAATPVTGTSYIPGAAGLRTDTIDCTMGIRDETGDGEMVLESIGDAANNVIVYSIELIYEM